MPLLSSRNLDGRRSSEPRVWYRVDASFHPCAGTRGMRILPRNTQLAGHAANRETRSPPEASGSGIQMLTTQPRRACMLDNFLIWERSLQLVVKLRFAQPALANARKSSLFARRVLSLSGYSANVFDDHRVSAERESGQVYLTRVNRAGEDKISVAMTGCFPFAQEVYISIRLLSSHCGFDECHNIIQMFSSPLRCLRTV
jgi:hypothetical protein